MIGYELEFLVREGNKPLSKAKFLEFHKILQADGWEPKYDVDTSGLAGSTLDGVYVTSDDGTGVLELNLPPTETVQESHDRVTRLLEKLQGIFNILGCSIIGTSVFPGDFDVLHPTCRDKCEHPDCCDKSMIKYIVAQRFHEYHHHWFIIAANHIWLDLPKTDVARQLFVFNRLSPIMYALFANGPIRDNSDTGVLDWRDKAWQISLEKSSIPQDPLIFGFYPKESATIFDYFDILMDSPPYFAYRDGVSFKVQDPKTTMRDLINSPSTPAIWGRGGNFNALQSIEDVNELQHTTFPHARLKYFLKNDLSVSDFLAAYNSRDEQKFLECFSKFCVEVRSVGAQKKEDVSVAPALCMGLQENIETLYALLTEHPYSFWTTLHTAVQNDGLKTVHEGIHLTELAQKILDIGAEGLKRRNHDEEPFLSPLYERIRTKVNPAEELREIWQKGGLDAIYTARDF